MDVLSCERMPPCDSSQKRNAAYIPIAEARGFTRRFDKAGTNYSMSLSGDNEAELKDYFEKLSLGGKVTMPLEKAIWGDIFGMLTDKFGVSWLVNIAGQKA